MVRKLGAGLLFVSGAGTAMLAFKTNHPDADVNWHAAIHVAAYFTFFVGLLLDYAALAWGSWIKLPDEGHVFCEQPLKEGSGPRYTNTFFSPAAVCTQTWNLGDPSVQSSTVTLNSVDRCVMLENVVTPVSPNVALEKSFVVTVSPVFETSVRIPSFTVAPPNGFAVAAKAAGASDEALSLRHRHRVPDPLDRLPARPSRASILAVGIRFCVR